MDSSGFILLFWCLALLIAVIAIGWSIYKGLNQRYDLLFWRTIKFYASCLGILGLVLLLLNMEKTIRDSIGGKNRELAFVNLYETRFFTTQYVSATCAHKEENKQAATDCDEARNADRLVSSSFILNNQFYPTLGYTQIQYRSKETEAFIQKVNKRLSYINTLMPEAANTGSFFSDDTRIKFFLLASILLSLSIAGSIGESAYQLKQAQATTAPPKQ
jgi:hypothetical protein